MEHYNAGISVGGRACGVAGLPCRDSGRSQLGERWGQGASLGVSWVKGGVRVPL